MKLKRFLKDLLIAMAVAIILGQTLYIIMLQGDVEFQKYNAEMYLQTGLREKARLEEQLKQCNEELENGYSK